MDAGRESLWLLLALGVAMALAAGLVYVLLFKGRRQLMAERAQRLRELAEHLGLRYFGSPAEDVLGALPRLGLLAGPRRKVLRNLVAEDRRPPYVLLFDLDFEPAGVMLEPTVYQVVMLRRRTAGADGPVAVCRMNALGGPVGRGLYSIELSDDPSFVRRYRVRGERHQVASTLRPDVRAALAGWGESGPSPMVEFLPGWLAVYVETALGPGQAARTARALFDYAVAVERAEGG